MKSLDTVEDDAAPFHDCVNIMNIFSPAIMLTILLT